MAQQKKVSRRKFMKITAGALGAGVVACGGSAWFGLRTPASVMFPRAACPYSLGDQILVAYASKCGATAELAERIASDLCSTGFRADLLPAGKVKDLTGYRAVVIGTAIYMGKPLAEARKLIEDFLFPRPDLPLALFNVSLTMKEDTPENAEVALGYLEELLSLVKPDLIGLFAGRIAMDTLPPLYRLFAQSDNEGALAEGDYRDWDQVSAWAAGLPDYLKL